LDIAKGAALMSGTTYDIDFVTGCYELLPNPVLSRLILEKLRAAGEISFTAEEKAFAKQLQATFAPGTVAHAFALTQELVSCELDPATMENPLWEQILPHSEKLTVMPGSTEVGDVSQITPTGQLTTC